MSKHTPGPWRNDCFMVLAPPNVGNYKGREICHTGGHDIRDGNESEANARLIAAAPDLLAACEQLMEYLKLLPLDENNDAAWASNAPQLARAAIAKAKGQ